LLLASECKNRKRIGLIGLAGIETTMFIEGTVDTLVFNAFCENFVRPCLRAGDGLMPENLGAHRASRIVEIVKNCGSIQVPILR
jgi:hypothetical protein